MPLSRRDCGIPAGPWPVSTVTWPAVRLRPLSPLASTGAARLPGPGHSGYPMAVTEWLPGSRCPEQLARPGLPLAACLGTAAELSPQHPPGFAPQHG
jgi:hypothetical protein